MIRDFAVEPEALNTWERFRYVMEKFGFHQGRVISRFPGKWERKVLKALNPEAHGTVMATRVTELLRRFRTDRIVDTGHVWDSTVDWMVNALAQADAGHPFHKILAIESDVERAIVGVDEADEDTFSVPRQAACDRTAAALVEHVVPLVRHAKIVRLVDRVILAKSPHQQRRWFEFPAQLLVALEELGVSVGSLEFHCVTRNRDPENEIENLRASVNRGLKGSGIRFCVWSTRDAVDAAHGRYVLTDVGGLGIDAGLDVADEKAQTDITILGSELWRERFSDFDASSPRYKLIAEFLPES